MNLHFEFLLYFLVNLTKAQELQNLFIIFRHGETTPHHCYLTKPDMWKDGPDQLTEKGSKRLYSMGKFYRDQFPSFLSDNYTHREFNVQSSNYDRALMSGQLMAAGFYSKSQTPLPIPWRPVPVHSRKLENDFIFANYDCKKFYKMIDEDYETEDAKEYLSKYRDSLDKINENLSKKIAIQDLRKLEDEIIAMNIEKFPLPAWLTQTIIDAISEICQHFRALAYQGTERLIFEAGSFAKTYTHHIEEWLKTGKILKPDLAAKHMMAFSGHDINIQSIMALFGVENIKLTDFGASLTIEIYGKKAPGSAKDYNVALKYKNDETKDPKSLKMSFCNGEIICPLNILLEHLKKYAVSEEEYEEKCKL